MLLALGLSLLLVAGVLVGAKVVYNRAAHQPVSLSPVAAPDADSPECSALLDRLPQKLAGLRGFQRADIADPAPAGAAVWSKDSQTMVSLRCGVSVPGQYTVASRPTTVEGVAWLQVGDDTPGSDLASWYSVNTQPVVAVTATRNDDPTTALSAALAPLPQVQRTPAPLPLVALTADPEHPQDATRDVCAPLLQALPDHLGEDYTRASSDVATRLEVPESTALYTADAGEPVVVRCGVAFPAEYEAGARLDEVNGVPWLTSTTLANGTTAGTFFALGFDRVVAVSTPRAVGGTAIASVSEAITANLTPTSVQ
ncbi:DUF3515 domain-containing protein [Corynebacterium sp. 13CS0277]|nr:DUF3515 domain-containing protein [Corynebacterium sp. 13CS0277]